MKRLFTITAAFVALMLIGSQSNADLLSDWGLTGQVYTNGSFGDWTNTSPRTETGMTMVGGNSEWWAEGNNTIPDNTSYGGPAPSGGEAFDIEFLSWRVVGNQFQVLGITSINPDTGVSDLGNVYHMGDVFVGTGATRPNFDGYDYALSNGVFTSPLADALNGGNQDHPADVGLYRIAGQSDVHGITGASGFGYGGSGGNLDELSNPFSINGTGSGEVGGAGVTRTVQQIQDDNGVGNWAVQWTMDLSTLETLLPVDPNTSARSFADLTLHWTVECGNDFIDTEASGQNEPTIPEPATLALLGLGLATLGMMRRRGHRITV